MRSLLLILALLGLAGQPPQREITPSAPSSGRLFLFFVDDLHLNFRDTGRIRDLCKKVAAELIQDGDRFAIGSSGPSSLAVDPTDDRQKLDAAINKVAGAGLKVEEITAAGGLFGVRYRARVALDSVLEILRKAGQIENRRKVLIYVSNGYDFDLSAKSASSSLPPTLRLDLSDLTGEAVRAKTTIYTVDARMLAGTADTAPKLDRVAMEAHVRRTQVSLRDIAEPTGGIAVLNAEDLSFALKRIAFETTARR